MNTSSEIPELEYAKTARAPEASLHPLTLMVASNAPISPVEKVHFSEKRTPPLKNLANNYSSGQ